MSDILSQEGEASFHGHGGRANGTGGVMIVGLSNSLLSMSQALATLRASSSLIQTQLATGQRFPTAASGSAQWAQVETIRTNLVGLEAELGSLERRRALFEVENATTNTLVALAEDMRATIVAATADTDNSDFVTQYAAFVDQFVQVAQNQDDFVADLGSAPSMTFGTIAQWSTENSPTPFPHIEYEVGEDTVTVLPGFFGGAPIVITTPAVVDDSQTAILGPLEFGGATTVSAWGRFDDLNVLRRPQLFSSDNVAANDPNSNAVTLGRGALENDMQFAVQVGGTTYSVVASNAIVEGEWAHWTGSVDSDGTMRLYKDGTLLATNATGMAPDQVVRANNSISGGQYDTINGAIADVRLIDGSVDDTAALQLYTDSLSGVRSGSFDDLLASFHDYQEYEQFSPLIDSSFDPTAPDALASFDRALASLIDSSVGTGRHQSATENRIELLRTQVAATESAISALGGLDVGAASTELAELQTQQAFLYLSMEITLETKRSLLDLFV